VSWRAVARKDVRDAGRSRTVWLLFGLLSVLFVGFAVVHERFGEPEFAAFLSGLAGLLASTLPVLAILLGYRSISDDRADGQLQLTLSFPHSRRDLVVGTVVGRSVVLLAPTLVALLAAGATGAYLYGTDGALLYPWFLFATALYGVAFVGLAVGLSLSTTTDRRITYGALGAYLLLVQLWDNLLSLLVVVLHRFEGGVLASPPDWVLLARLAKPSESYYRLVRAGFDVGLAEPYVGAGVPAVVAWPVALLLLVGWLAVPLALGYRRFGTADL
jgi:ABC-type transport system involved in multi-copper enzyme maturation permease subunit